MNRTYAAPIGINHPSSGAFAPVNPSSWNSAVYPLGAIHQKNATTFSVYSKNATRVLLEIYDTATDSEAKHDYWLEKNTDDDIWRCKIKQVPEGCFYAFRDWGPNWPFDEASQRGNSAQGFISDVDEYGNRFNPNKVLFDPYAKELSHDKEKPEMFDAGHNGGMYGTGDGDYQGEVRRNVDTARWVPKSIVLAKNKTSFGRKPKLPAKDAVIYETYIRGLTKSASASSLNDLLSNYSCFEEVPNVPAEYRGT